MTEILAPADGDARARRNVAVLVAAQALIGAQLPMIFTIGGLAGQTLAPNPCLATVPISMIVVGSMLTATPLSAAMQKWGRRTGFFIGALGGMLGAITGAVGLYENSFLLFLAGSLMTGIYMSAQGFYRFAAADTASEGFQAKAISYVMAGGLASAIVGPQLVKMTSGALAVPFLGTYLAVVGLNAVGFLLFPLVDIPRVARPHHDAPRGRTRWQLITTPRIAVAVICATVSYALMNLMMTSAPLAVVGCGFHTDDAANIVSAHVLSMYVPSFFTGFLIARFGVEKIIGTGLVILAGSATVALAGVALTNFFGALMLLGIGWNFGFIGATTMLASAHAPSERGRMQGLNDLIVFGGVTMASFASGGLMNCSGGTPQAGWHAVSMMMAPLIVLAGGALIWLAFRPADSEIIT
ncbi:MFS transporter [Solirhodobacter olei]|uniref:MFS transporter n=1 Tax=Solirhodobacter olei TaxID=2493082 RepID=UPI000FD79E38|nr:MFS transporter [Solirhodobacter olei]